MSRGENRRHDAEVGLQVNVTAGDASTPVRNRDVMMLLPDQSSCLKPI